MADLNFGLLDTTLPARIAAIPQEAQKQQSANMLQAMQMQGAMRQNEMSQMQLDELKNDRAEMVKLQQDLAAKGGSPDLNQYADMLLKSPKHLQLGIQLKEKLAKQAQFAEAMRDEPPRTHCHHAGCGAYGRARTWIIWRGCSRAYGGGARLGARQCACAPCCAAS